MIMATGHSGHDRNGYRVPAGPADVDPSRVPVVIGILNVDPIKGNPSRGPPQLDALKSPHGDPIQGTPSRDLLCGNQGDRLGEHHWCPPWWGPPRRTHSVGPHYGNASRGNFTWNAPNHLRRSNSLILK
jgi:hypothetical protein